MKSGAQLSGRVRLLLTAVLAGASTCLLGTSFTMGASVPAVLMRNETPIQLRLMVIAVAWLTGILLGGLCLWIDYRDKSETFRKRAIGFLAPWTLAAFVPLLYCQDAWEKREFAHLVLLMAFGLALERTLRGLIRSRTRVDDSTGLTRAPSFLRFLAPLCLALSVGMALFYFFRIGHLTVVSHHKLATTTSDLAEYDNMFFNALHGHPFRSPAIAAMLKDFSSLQGHAELALYLLLPFYAISPGAEALLWIQTGLVAFASIPLYLLARSRMHPVAALAFPLAHLTMPAVQQPNFYDFHFTSAATFFVSWLLYFLHSFHLKPSRAAKVAIYVFMACALCCREDVAIGIAVLGLFLILEGSLVREGIRILAIGAVYFVAMKFFIMPLFGTWWFETQYADLQARGAKGFGSVILTLLSNQAFVLRALLIEPKALYLLHMTVPVLALWLRRPLLLFAILPGFVSTLLVTNREPLFQVSFQYTYLWVPYVLAASVLAVQRRFAFAVAIPLVLVGLSLDNQRGVLLGGTSILGGFGTKTFEFSEAEAKRLKELNEIIALIPREASVASTEAEGPHVSNRLELYSLKFSLGHEPDYLLVGPTGYGAETNHIRKALESGQYGVIASKGLFILAKRGADKAKNSELSRRIRGR